MADPDVVAGLLLARCDLMKTEGPALPVAMPDVSFAPPTSGKYLRVDLFTNAPFWEGLKSGKIDQGLLQVTVVWPRNTGAIAIRKAVADVLAHFPKGLALFGPAARVRVNKEPWEASPIIEDDKTSIPITISWTAV